ncbi:glycoside hydrolase family 28 protein [Didymella exigua CBS 183.55]|uniref:Glycoside hydrolase family 28 protein n=1 Tax=Didymella exigua CBS 183.55 TaxID=1150837 RepID=A0A6A5R640_9PLEO|nr:glycoside hydrolase family 28 protein [Didymella exigua CBS 183.55]KAF1923043.1 glycoside hydrolase family 28 protein [Didymella exigua CBS 183.55]
MANTTVSATKSLPDGLAFDTSFDVLFRSVDLDSEIPESWTSLQAYIARVAEANTDRNDLHIHEVAVASLQIVPGKSLEFQICCNTLKVYTAAIRPSSLHIPTKIDSGRVTFTLERAIDFMVEINGDKWQALHLLVTYVDAQAPSSDGNGIWYFGTGVNNGAASSKIIDGALIIPSETTVYLAHGAILTAQVQFVDVKNSAVKGPGIIFRPAYEAESSSRPRELAGGAILIERSKNITVQSVTSLRSFGFSLCVGEGQDIHIDRYRSLSGYGNGDGIDLFCCKDVLVENCFLRNSDDTIAIYGHRWNYYGDTQNIRINNCTLLPDIAHPIHIGTHGNPQVPETLSDIYISNIDILDHCEHQMWYQGCISINAGDENLIHDVLVENVQVEKITKGQLFNIRTMKNAMWTTAPGRGVKNVTFRNVELHTNRSSLVYPSQVLGFERGRGVEGVMFEQLTIGGKVVHDDMQKPKWYMVSDFVPAFVNEHVVDLVFKLNDSK